MFCDQRNVAWEKESLNVVQDIRLSYCSVWYQQGPDRTSGQDRYAPRRVRRGRLREYFATLPEQLESLSAKSTQRREMRGLRSKPFNAHFCDPPEASKETLIQSVFP